MLNEIFDVCTDNVQVRNKFATGLGNLKKKKRHAQEQLRCLLQTQVLNVG